MFRKLTIPFATFAIFLLALPQRIFAQDSPIRFSNPSGYNSLEEVILSLVSILQPVVVLAFVAMVLYGGWVYLSSQGDAEKIGKAKQIIVAAIIGFIIIVLAPTIVQLLASVLSVDPGLVTVV